MELKINKTLEEIIPKLHPEDYEALKKEIQEQGLLKPIDIMADGTIVDGHHRYKICQELGIEPLYSVLPNVKTVEQAIKYSYTINYARRHINTFERAEWAYNVAKNIMAPMAPRSSRAEFTDLGQKSLAELAKIPERTMDRAKKVIEKGSAELKELVRNEKLSISAAEKLVTALEDIPEKAKKNLEKRIVEADDPTQELPKVIEIIGYTNAAKEYLANTEESIAKKIESDYKNLFFTENMTKDIVEKIHQEIRVAEGLPRKLVKKYLPIEKFADEVEASAYFKKFSGRLIGKVKVEMWVGEVDPYEYKENQD